MKNGLKIRWTEEATKNLENIIDYLDVNWTSREVKRFFHKLEKQLTILSNFPDAYPISKKRKAVHRCVFSANHIIYYKVQGDSLVLLSIFDTRQNPEKGLFG
jgi:plasmid stabilization system protein ParE